MNVVKIFVIIAVYPWLVNEYIKLWRELSSMMESITSQYFICKEPDSSTLWWNLATWIRKFPDFEKNRRKEAETWQQCFTQTYEEWRQESDVWCNYVLPFSEIFMPSEHHSAKAKKDEFSFLRHSYNHFAKDSKGTFSFFKCIRQAATNASIDLRKWIAKKALDLKRSGRKFCTSCLLFQRRCFKLKLPIFKDLGYLTRDAMKWVLWYPWRQMKGLLFFVNHVNFSNIELKMPSLASLANWIAKAERLFLIMVEASALHIISLLSARGAQVARDMKSGVRQALENDSMTRYNATGNTKAICCRVQAYFLPMRSRRDCFENDSNSSSIDNFI